MGIRNLIALAVHPLMALATSLVFLLIASLQPVSREMQIAVILTSGLVLIGIAQAMGRREMLSLRASPTNYGQTIALLGLAVGLAAFHDGGGTIWVSADINLTLAIGAGIITFIEGLTRLVFMIRVWRMGSEEYARKRIERILSGRMCNWNTRIDAAIRMASGRSIVHDRHALDLAQAARSAMGTGAMSTAC
ncbi:hypothetical protein [uncultured Salinicola sp.]|uniref:hypothetical protein n=1 Tax=uncultured Salinicola sp. TaxID=1193542 RepID=UPI002634CCEB|nr:hypothetical protein [uncultured Salinicola sp.]|tara:strand:+ start:514 stop:1089 length:576 start_codon:yes stop_codon:yes gene_type:complete